MIRAATATDVGTLVDLMAEFYAEAGYPLVRHRAAAAFGDLLADPRLGRVLLVERDGAVAGYLVLTFTFGMEFGGLVAAVDDLYVRPSFRNVGLGGELLDAARAGCVAAGARGVTVEVAADNEPALAAYRRAGFVMTERRLMLLELAAPAHED